MRLRPNHVLFLFLLAAVLTGSSRFAQAASDAVRAPEDITYAYNLYDWEDTPRGLYSMRLGDFSELTWIGDPGEDLHAWAFSADGQTLYAIRSSEEMTPVLGTVDTSTGEFSAIATLETMGVQRVTGLAIDPVTDEAYLSTTHYLARVDLADGSVQTVGPFAMAPGEMLDLAAHCDGTLYGHDFWEMSLVTVDRDTGQAAALDRHTWPVISTQGMTFDREDGRLYAALNVAPYAPGYGVFNLHTGAFTPLVETFPSGHWLLASPSVCGPRVEHEPNNTTTDATPVQLPLNDRTAVVEGTSTSTDDPDYFRFRTPVRPRGFYRYRIALSSDTPGHRLDVIGLTQLDGVIGTTQTVAQQALIDGQGRPFVQWYGTEQPGEIDVRVTGTEGSTDSYRIDFEAAPAPVIDAPVSLRPGPVTIATDSAIDTDLWLHDGGRAPVPGHGNDDANGGTGSVLTRSLPIGTHYLAITRSNLANHLPSPADDEHRDGTVLARPGSVLSSSPLGGGGEIGLSINGQSVAAALNDPFEVVFVRFFVGQYEVEPNDSKDQANPIDLPPHRSQGVVSGFDNAGFGVRGDYFRMRNAEQAVPAFYRHRLIVADSTLGVSLSIRGKRVLDGVLIDTSDSAVQTSLRATYPEHHIQWYTNEQPADIYVQARGGQSTVDEYRLDYEIERVSVIEGPELDAGEIVISALGLTAINTDLAVYDGSRTLIPDYSNDDASAEEFQSRLVREYTPGTYYVAISDHNLVSSYLRAHDEGRANPNDYALDYPGALVSSLSSAWLSIGVSIGGEVYHFEKPGAFGVTFIRFTVRGEKPEDRLFANGFED